MSSYSENRSKAANGGLARCQTLPINDYSVSSKPRIMHQHHIKDKEAMSTNNYVALQPSLMQFHPQYDLLEAYTRVVEAGNSDAQNSQSMNFSGATSGIITERQLVGSDTDNDSPSRLRKLQVKDSSDKRGAPTPNEISDDLHEVLDFGNFQTHESGHGTKKKRIKSQQRPRRPPMGQHLQRARRATAGGTVTLNYDQQSTQAETKKNVAVTTITSLVVPDLLSSQQPRLNSSVSQVRHSSALNKNNSKIEACRTRQITSRKKFDDHSLQGSRQTVLDLNRQVVEGDQKGALKLRQIGTNTTRNQDRSNNLQQQHLRVQIETKNRGVMVGRSLNFKQNQQKQKRRLKQNNCISSTESLAGATLHASALKNTCGSMTIFKQHSPEFVKKSDEEEGVEQKTTSSFFTSGMPLSNIKNPKMQSHLREQSGSTRNQKNDILACNNNYKEFGSSRPTEHCLEDVTPPDCQDFIIKTFQNSLESKVQREARQKGSAGHPYQYQRHKIVVNRFDTQNAQNTINNVLISHKQRSSDYQQSLLRESNASPTRIRVDSFDDGIKRGGQDIADMKFSTHKKQTSSFFVSEGPEIFSVGNDAMVAGDEYNDKLNKFMQCQKTSLDAAENYIKDALQSLTMKDEKSHHQEFSTDLNYVSHEDHIKAQNTDQPDEKTVLAQPSQKSLNDQGDMCVYHLKLQPHTNYRISTAHVRRDHSIKHALCTQSSKLARSIDCQDLGSSASQRTVRQAFSAAPVRSYKSKISRQRSAVQKKILQKRIDATKNFNKKFGEPISIRRTYVMQQSNQKSNQNSNSLRDLSLGERTEEKLPQDGESPSSTTNKQQSAIGVESTHAISSVVKHTGKMYNMPHSLVVRTKSNSSYRLSHREARTMELMKHEKHQDSNLSNSGIVAPPAILDSASDTYAAKSFKAKRHTGSSTCNAANNTNKLLFDQCAVRSEYEDAVVSGRSKQKSKPASANLYKLSAEEKDQIKVKNRTLISQFQKSELKRQLIDEPSSWNNTHRQQNTARIEEGETVSSDVTAVGKFTEKSTQMAENTIARGDLLLQDEQNIKKPIPGMDSLNSPNNEVGSYSPVMQATQCGHVVLKRPKDNFTTAQLSSSEAQAELTLTQDKNAARSGATTTMVTVMKNANAQIKKNCKKRLISSGDSSCNSPKNRFSIDILVQQDLVNLAPETINNQPELEKQVVATLGQKAEIHCSINTSQLQLRSLNTAEFYRQGTNESGMNILHEIQQQKEVLQETAGSAASASDVAPGKIQNQDLAHVENFNIQHRGSNQSRSSSESKEEQEDIQVVRFDAHQKVKQQSSALPGDLILSADRILSMSEPQIEQLKFQDVCMCQQVLYNALNNLQEQLSKAELFRKTKGGYQSQIGKMVRNPSQILERRIHSIKQQRFTTNYEGNQKNNKSRPDTAFSKEQRELRKRWIHQNRMLYGTNQQVAQQKPSKDQVIKFKLIDEDCDNRPKDKKRQEVDNYFKFKLKQEKSKKRQEKFEQQKTLLNKCSPEEVLILGKIKILMDTQQMLASKAQMCTIQELILTENDNNHVQTEANEDYLQARKIDHQQVMEQRMESLRRLQIEEVIDSKHLPVAQRVASRQSLHKVNRTGDVSKAQNLIMAATEKLNSINRKMNRPSSNVIPKSLLKKKALGMMIPAGASSDSNLEGRLRARSGLSYSSTRMPQMQIQPVTSEIVFSHYSYGDVQKDMLSGHVEMNSPRNPINFVDSEPGREQSVAKKINMYLKKVSTTDRQSNNTPDMGGIILTAKMTPAPISTQQATIAAAVEHEEAYSKLRYKPSTREIKAQERIVLPDLNSVVTFETQADNQQTDFKSPGSFISIDQTPEMNQSSSIELVYQPEHRNLDPRLANGQGIGRGNKAQPIHNVKNTKVRQALKRIKPSFSTAAQSSSHMIQPTVNKMANSSGESSVRSSEQDLPQRMIHDI